MGNNALVGDQMAEEHQVGILAGKEGGAVIVVTDPDNIAWVGSTLLDVKYRFHLSSCRKIAPKALSNWIS